MKTILLGAAALAAISLASAANAQTFSTGYVGGSYTTVNTGDSKAHTNDAQIFAVRGVASFELAKNLETQLDGDVAAVDFGIPAYSNVTTWGPTAHVFLDKDGNKIGAFVGYEDAGNDSVTAYGLEARMASGPFTFGATAGFGSLNAPGTTYNNDLRTYRGQVSYFVNENLRIDVSGDSFRVSNNNRFSKGSLTVFGIGGEFQPMGFPVSLTAGVEQSSVSGHTYDAYTVGVRKSFGGTLKDRDRKSSPFDSVAQNYGGALGLLETSLDGASYRAQHCVTTVQSCAN